MSVQRTGEHLLGEDRAHIPAMVLMVVSNEAQRARLVASRLFCCLSLTSACRAAHHEHDRVTTLARAVFSPCRAGATCPRSTRRAVAACVAER
jgi:hypothetical protein